MAKATPLPPPAHLSTDVLVVGSGGAGMYAAVAAARAGAQVLLADKSLIGRGGATIMAQMTVAAAVGEQEPDHWTHHLADTLEAGRGLCNEALSAILCEEAPIRIREMDDWKVGWARENGHMKQVMAPGHSVSRCVYVDFLNTGPAVARTLRGQVAQTSGITRVSGLAIVEPLLRSGEVVGAVGVDVTDGRSVTISAKAVILAAGGLTRLYRRNSASVNMGGDAYALALRAGAELVDMEFVQFFPIGHLAPRMVGMDPIMWDPFRYKLGGRLLNGREEEFIENYGASDGGVYTAPRDVTSYAIWKEVEAGRGSPAGGAYLSFQHIPEDKLRAAFGPVIKRLAENGIDLTKRSVEVAPIAHYHMGGIRVDETMATRVPGLYAAGEAVGGANGANRLSGNAIPEAFVFGERAGRFAAQRAATMSQPDWDTTLVAATLGYWREHERDPKAAVDPEQPTLFAELQSLMWEKVGLLRTEAGLQAALERIKDMQSRYRADYPIHHGLPFDMALTDWLELRNGLLTAEAVTMAALARTESRGAHQREDFPQTDPAQTVNQIVSLENGHVSVARVPVNKTRFDLQPPVAAA